MKRIYLSQLVGLISATYETRDIKAFTAPINWESLFHYKGIPTQKGIYEICPTTIHLEWKNKTWCGHKEQELLISFNWTEVKYSGANRYFKPLGRIFLYTGDNCNERTVFLYHLMGNETDIVDDLGIVGSQGKLGKKSICHLSAAKHFCYQVNGLEDEF